MKRILFFCLSFICSAVLFSQSTDYQKFMKRAKSYEEKNYWIFAMADYYQAMEAEPTHLAEDAYKRFFEIRDAIASGAPAPSDVFNMEETDPFEIHDRWAFLYKEYNSFWNKHSPVSFEFSSWYKDSLNYENKTAKYYSEVSSQWSKMYQIIHDAVSSGYRTAHRSDWKDLDVSWNADVKELSSYSLVFNLMDSEGNIIAENQEIKPNGYYSKYYIEGISKKNMKLFEENKVGVSLVLVKINDLPTKISLKDIHVKFPDKTGHLDNDIKSAIESALAERNWLVIEEKRKLEEEKQKEKELALFTAAQEEFKKKPPKMIRIESGSFKMGKDINHPSYNYFEYPSHMVNISSLKISATEITQKQFYTVMGYNPSSFKNDRNPVENLSWHEAVAFCNKASLLRGLQPCYSINGETNPDLWEQTTVTYEDQKNDPYYSYDKKTKSTIIFNGEIKCYFNKNGYRLPTEAEWEYCATEGKLCSAWKFSGSDNLNEIAWNSENCTEPHPVAKRIPNALGLYDMTGNVSEFCWDSYDTFYFDYSSCNNPTGPATNKNKSVRGGSYKTNSENKNRAFIEEYRQSSETGFRIVQTTEKRVWDDLTPEEKVAKDTDNFKKNGPSMKLISKDSNKFYIGTYEVAQYEWISIMGKNPSKFSYNLKNPVEGVTYLECVYFCNKLSEMFGYTPCYEIDGNINADEWDYNSEKENTKSTKVTCNLKANGFRLPTRNEYNCTGLWETSLFWKTGYSWTSEDSHNRTHPVGSKNEDSNDLYDLYGNVSELAQDGNKADPVGWNIYSSYYENIGKITGLRLARTCSPD